MEPSEPTVDVIQVVVPEEPPDGSVVLDPVGRAWQRSVNLWFRAAAPLYAPGMSWPHLVVDRGPIRVIHRAETV